MNDKYEILKEKYLERSRKLIDKYDILKIIYLRVSTKNEGQEESDQLPDILEIFNLKEEECLVIKAKESAFQLNKQKHRVLNIIKDIIEEFEDEEKILYLWDLDRLYRNQELQVEFIQGSFKKNCRVLSYRQKWLYQLREMGGLGKAMYNFMIEFSGWMGEEESKKRGDRLIKSLTKKEGRFYTNKGNLYGKKLKSITGKKLKLSASDLNQLELAIAKRIKSGLTYRAIQQLVAEKKQIHISLGHLTNIKKKYL